MEITSVINSSIPDKVVIAIIDSKGLIIKVMPSIIINVVIKTNQSPFVPIIDDKFIDNCNLNKLFTIIHIPKIIGNTLIKSFL